MPTQERTIQEQLEHLRARVQVKLARLSPARMGGDLVWVCGGIASAAIDTEGTAMQLFHAYHPDRTDEDVEEIQLSYRLATARFAEEVTGLRQLIQACQASEDAQVQVFAWLKSAIEQGVCSVEEQVSLVGLYSVEDMIEEFLVGQFIVPYEERQRLEGR
jgi:hypothetical protein